MSLSTPLPTDGFAKKKKKSKNKDWEWGKFPYQVDYCDHFETPRRAYEDILPLLDQVCGNQPRSKVTIYDPYYCNGRTGKLLRELGYQVEHHKRDFYQDIQDQKIPLHDVLVTNPPYSDDHKKKCLEFCFAQLRGQQKRPFAILMPNYVAARHYFQDLLRLSPTEDVVYFVPTCNYEYDHPEGTGKAESPFQSLWFVGVPAVHPWRKGQGGTVVTSLKHLSTFNQDYIRCFQKRLNPKQRRKRKLLQATGSSPPKQSLDDNNRTSLPYMQSLDKNQQSLQPESTRKSHKKSKYRDESGQRKKKRF